MVATAGGAGIPRGSQGFLLTLTGGKEFIGAREIAGELGSTARAVGQACGDNRLPLAIPCHRVVAASGLGGFAHRTDRGMLDVKRWLLAHESRAVFALTP